MQPNDKLIDDLQKHGWAVCENWIPAEKVTTLQPLFTELDFHEAKIGKDENLQRRPEIRGDYTSWINHLLPPFKLLSTIDKLEELRMRFNRELYMGLRDWEIHLAKYPPQSIYRRHLDRHETTSRRVLSVVLYLNPHWHDGDGGELVIYDSHNVELKRVSPQAGTLVCFLSADFPHEVLPSTRERRSLTGWFLSGDTNVPSL